MFVRLVQEFPGKKRGERIDLEEERTEKRVELGVATVFSDDLMC